MRAALSLGLAAVFCLGFRPGLAAPFPYPGGWSQTSTAETPACGTSPCTVGTTSTTILNASGSRFQCLIQNVAPSTVYCVHGTSTPSTSNYHFALKGASGTSTGDGASYSCGQGASLWHGVFKCITVSTSGTVAVSAAGF